MTVPTWRDGIDLVVVGGGIAGLIAANRAAERGIKAVVLEKGEAELYLCNSRYTGGVFHVAFHNPMRPPEDLMRIINEATSGRADPAMASAIAENIGTVIRWLQREGIRFVKAGPGEWQDFILSPPQYPRAGLHWPGRGGDVLLRTLEERLERRGGRVMRGMRVTSMERTADGGFTLAGEGRNQDQLPRARAVILADGGFQGNPQMLREHVTVDPEGMRQRGAGTGCGDGFHLATRLGAAVIPAGEFYGHVLSQDSLKNDMLWPYPWIDDLAGAGIVVDGSARRFVDEGRGGVVLANALARLPDPLGAITVFDEATWQDVGRDMLIPANPLLEVHGCTIHRAPTIAGLATATGVDPVALTRTIDAYNDALTSGTLAGLDPPRNQKRFRSRPIANGPFRAIRVCAGITYTMGGIAIDGRSRVLDAGQSTLPGLYAAGATTGGLEGGEAVGYVGGLAKSAVTGFLAGDTVAADLLAQVAA